MISSLAWDLDVDVVGVGPGAPDLLTLRAVRAVQSADIVVHIRTGSGGSMAWDAAQSAVLPGQPSMAWDIDMLAQEAQRGHSYHVFACEFCHQVMVKGWRKVALLCLGDPTLYGSWFKAVEALRSAYTGRISVRLIPGIAACSAAMARIGLPAALGQDTVRIITGQDCREACSPRDVLADYRTVFIFKPSLAGQGFWREWASLLPVAGVTVWLVGGLEAPLAWCRNLGEEGNAWDKDWESYFRMVVVQRAE